MAREDQKIIGSYSTQEEALAAVRELKKEGYQEEDITLYGTKETEARLKSQETGFLTRTADPDVQEGDILYLYKNEIANGGIVIVAGQDTHFDGAVREQNKESSKGFGPDNVAANEEKPDDNFNSDAVDPREAGDNVHITRITGMNTDSGKTRLDEETRKKNQRASSKSKPLDQDQLSRTDKDNSETTQADSPQHDRNMNLTNRESRVRDGYNREPLDYGVNADPSGRTLTPNAGNEGANVSPFNDMTEDIPERQTAYDQEGAPSGGRTLEDEGKTLTEEVNPRNDSVDRGGDRPVDVEDFEEDQDEQTDKYGDDRDRKERNRRK